MTPAPGDSRTATEPDAVIAGYRILDVLARGADGATFRAEAPDGAAVTMHLLRRPPGGGGAARFSARAEQLSGLSHPALPRVLGFGEAPEGLWIAGAETQGVSLRNLLADGIAPMHAVRLLGEIADGLDVAHRAGLAHGDVRPENVIVQERPVVRAALVDFALLPPGEPTAEADVSALAAVLYECLAGAPPSGKEGERARPEPLGPELPSSLNGIVARGLAGRTESAPELMAQAARAFLEEDTAATGGTPVAEPAARPAARPAWRRHALGALGAILVVGAAGAAGWALSRESTPDEPRAPSVATAGVVTVTVPDGWERSGTPTRDSRPALTRPISLGNPGSDGRIAVGLAADRGAVLNPSRLAVAVGGGRPRAREVRLGRLEAVRIEGRGILYVAPTTAGAAVVACSETAADPCAEAARGLTVRGARGYDPAAGIAWKNELAADMRRLGARRSAGLRRLRRAATAAGQARRARELATIHAAAARRLRGRPAPPQARRARRLVLTRLLAADRAYRALARAAATASETSFKRATARVQTADGALRTTLRAL